MTKTIINLINSCQWTIRKKIQKIIFCPLQIKIFIKNYCNKTQNYMMCMQLNHPKKKEESKEF